MPSPIWRCTNECASFASWEPRNICSKWELQKTLMYNRMIQFFSIFIHLNIFRKQLMPFWWRKGCYISHMWNVTHPLSQSLLIYLATMHLIQRLFKYLAPAWCSRVLRKKIRLGKVISQGKTKVHQHSLLIKVLKRVLYFDGIKS